MSLAKVLKRYDKAYAAEIRKGIMRAYNEHEDYIIDVLFDPMSGRWTTSVRRIDQQFTSSVSYLIDSMCPWHLTDLPGITHDGIQYCRDDVPISTKQAQECRDKTIDQWMPQYATSVTREHFRKKITKFWQGRQK